MPSKNPLAVTRYRQLWLVGLARNFGTWMHNMAAAAALAALSPSPLLNSLLYAATMLPVFFLSVPAGLFADRFGRGFVMVWSSVACIVAACAFLVLSVRGELTIGWLIALTFLINAGWAITYPAWNAEVASALPREQRKDGASLNSLSYNLARTFGPAIAGYIYAAYGGAPVYVLNAVSFVGFIVAFRGQLRPRRPVDGPAGATLRDLFRQMIGLVRESELFRAVLWRTCLYFFVGQMLWSLLPVFVLREEGMSERDLGVVTAAAGAGAIVQALGYPWLRRRIDDNRILVWAGVLTALCTAALPFLRSVPALLLPLAVYGAVYASAVTINNGLLQTHIPDELRGRAIGLYVVVLYGVQSAGSVVSGWLSGWLGFGATCLALGAVLVVASTLGAVRWPILERRPDHATEI